jgi:serine protease
MRKIVLFAAAALSFADEAALAAPRVIEPGQPAVVLHPTVEAAAAARLVGALQAGSGSELSYHGGSRGIGVETAPKVYLVLWGRQWKQGDPSGEVALLKGFFKGVGGSAWLNTVTQYCQDVPVGTTFCNGQGTPAGNQPGMLAGVWADRGSPAPSHPTQSQLAAEAIAAARHFGNTTGESNASVQYVIATSPNHSSAGFGSQFCAWHTWTRSAVGRVSYTNLPYITDAGANCGADFNGLGADAGITLIEGHEFTEAITDPFPITGWVDDSGGYEIGDVCAWVQTGQGAAAFTTFTTGTFAVQSLWSNAFDGDAGGCVLSY